MTRDQFGPEYIQHELRAIGDNLQQSVTVFLIGGGAMALRNLKDTTKDIDLVVTTQSEYERLLSTLTSLGYEEVTELGDAYQQLGARMCVENEDGCRIDLFNQQVANKLIFSEGMRTRSDDYLTEGSLSVKLTSFEDIFLFKAVAKRPDDIDDMATLVQTQLDFDRIETELETQAELLGSDLFATYIFESLTKLEERHGIQTPIEETVTRRNHRYMREFEVRLHLDEETPTPITELADELDIDTDELRERITRLEDQGFVEWTEEGLLDTGETELFDT